MSIGMCCGSKAAEKEIDLVEHSAFLTKLLGVILVVGPIVKEVRRKQFGEACALASKSPTIS